LPSGGREWPKRVVGPGVFTGTGRPESGLCGRVDTEHESGMRTNDGMKKRLVKAGKPAGQFANRRILMLMIRPTPTSDARTDEPP
jgi:hypothetical protein